MISEEQLLDIFQRPLYDIHRAWRGPLFRIVRRLSQGILEGTPTAEDRCTLAFLLLPGLVAECHYGKWIPVAALLSHLESGIDCACSDDDYGALVLAQAQEVVPRVQAYRDRAAARRSSPYCGGGLSAQHRPPLTSTATRGCQPAAGQAPGYPAEWSGFFGHGSDVGSSRPGREALSPGQRARCLHCSKLKRRHR